MNYNYIENFEKSRKNRIGASDVPALIPHPTRQIESLAAYTDEKGQRQAMTAIDLYNKKINGKEYKYSFPAEMGHYLEGRILYEFIKDNISEQIAREFLRGYQTYKIDRESSKNLHPGSYNTTPFKHHTESANDWGVAHGDCLYEPLIGSNTDKRIIKNNDLKIDLSTAFLIEAKSARYFSARRKDDPFTGYDLILKEWQGIPLKYYMQIQYQMLLYNVDICYLALIYDTSSKHYWTIKANKKHQAELQQLAKYMKKCLDTKTPPKNLMMNAKDIKYLYPEITDDFREVKDDELKEILQLAKNYNEAKTQESIWKKRKEQYKERIAIHLKDTKILKANIDGHLVDVANWKTTGGYDRICGLTDIKKRDDSDRIIKYLKKNKLIKHTDINTNANICIKNKDFEGIEI